MTPAEFKAEYPEFASVSDAVVQLAIDRSVPHFDLDRWGTRYAEGVGFWVAHRLAMANVGATFGAGSGSAETKRVGSVSVTRSTTFGGINSSGSSYQLTNYGKAYLSLAVKVGVGALAV